MRTREEIETALKSRNLSFQDLASFQIEVLLDIRDILDRRVAIAEERVSGASSSRKA